MDLSKAVENVATAVDLKRIASAYVIDYRNLSNEDIKSGLIKTAPQYYFKDNVERSVNEIFLNENRNYRILSRFILFNVLMQKDNFMSPKKETEDDIIAIEQSIIDQSNEDLLRTGSERGKSFELFQFVVETAWDHNDSISSDEKNLIDKIKTRLKITDMEYQIIEAKLGKFPKHGNELNTRGEIDEVRRFLQSKGLLFCIRDNDGTDFDVIPDEIAKVLREALNLEIRQHGYKDLISHKSVRSKKYYIDILKKCEIPVDGASTIEALQDVIISHLPPSTLLGGISPRDGLEISALKKWCSELKLPVSGVKTEMINRIIEYYDNIRFKDETVGDEREHWYQVYTKFAGRDLGFLRNQQLIQKDIECERKFEEATDYLFEKKLLHKPLKLIGTNHADGALSFQDKIIYWDNKSKETSVNLKDHIRQFDSYIKTSEKPVACFFVIAPEFTDESSLLAMQYQVENGVSITLITADELKSVAEAWSSRDSGKLEDPFPLGYMVQPGRLNKDLIAGIL